MDLSGIYPPIAIPFTQEEAIDFESLHFNLQRWLSEPIDGLVVPGSNSEAAYMSLEERLAVMRVCAQAARAAGKRLIAGTGMETTADTIRLTQAAAELGADAALLLPPYFYKPAMNRAVLTAHYRAVADASPIPLLVYNVPQFTGVAFDNPTLVELAQHEKIAGIKDSSSNIVQMASLKALCPSFQIFAGTGSALLPFLSIGGAGCIAALANFAAAALREVWQAYAAGRNAEAAALQVRLAQINAAVTSTYGVPGLKYAMQRCGYRGGWPRRPLLPLDASGQAAVDALLDALGLAAPNS
ncbi:dihydrodipicolinate synthase family protein [Levilinea saccharolytica]|uniref:Dihydrodipicolinate synthase n=1 Tax=Levilinea saccharolytica TaxID=229921 RepID=A0A0P6XSJ8_9CHLR|nr:dihydrodipicolinate synthase family protein [Levilinea saccharolytica]KPL79695.1 hypothetical protein ADN01_13425 [Levilinea saccharolytica]GAP16999.1 dihydrodipicolinate synthase [Levilinea saccharolytica]